MSSKFPTGSGGERPDWVSWLVEHRVGPNLVMLVLLLGGLFMTTKITQEVFPEFEIDMVTVSVSYPGATPEEIERGVVVPVEAAVRGLAGIQKVTSSAQEGSGQVMLELIAGVDRQEVYQDVEQAVARIRTFPAEAEKPEVSLRMRRRDVLDLMIYGDVPAHSLRAAAEQVVDRLLLSPEVTQAEVDGAPALEIHIDIDEARLRSYGLTHAQVAQAVAANAQDRTAGTVETRRGDLLLQVEGQKVRAREFANIVVLSNAAGALVRLGDIATVREGFTVLQEEVSSFNGEPAIEIGVYRVGNQTPQGVSAAVRAMMPEIMADLPPDIKFAIQHDSSEVYQQRLELLLKNGFYGLLLVLVLLSLFLEFKLAFWVTVGIPTAFLGALLFLPWMGVSINMISLFAFIVALGIVVDDAIIAGENIYEYRQRGMSMVQAAIQGTRDVAVPITFAVLTNIIAFLPLALIPGAFGQIWKVLPLVVGTVFAISLVEALIILPAHLAHTKESPRNSLLGRLHGWQQRFSNWFSHFVENRYGPFLRRALDFRYLTVACAIAILLVTLAYAFGGRMGFILMPRVESDTASVTATLPLGAPLKDARQVESVLLESAQKIIAENGQTALSRGVFSSIQGNVVEVRAYLEPPEQRPISTAVFVERWREAAGPLPGLESLRFTSERGGPGGGAGVTVQLSHPDTATLNRASVTLAERLQVLAAVKDVDDGFTPGKPQWTFHLNDSGRALGLTVDDVGRQVRNSVLGAEALRLLRDGEEVTVRVRLPQADSANEEAIAGLMLQTPSGQYVPLQQVVDIERGRALTGISRQDGRRVISVTAEVEPIGETSQVLTSLTEEFLPQLQRDFPGLVYSFEGQQASMRDAIDSFLQSVTLALLAIYALLAIPFRSYSQPAIIMISIPFGVVGALLGHMLMGYNLSLVSVMGMIALGGVVINDALVMIDYANQRRLEGVDAAQAIFEAGVRRFRPIMLTTLTTFGGLAPMIFETSRQARFMIPMALSLGYGILIATAILLLLIPCLYLVLEDAGNLMRRMLGREQVAVDGKAELS